MIIKYTQIKFLTLLLIITTAGSSLANDIQSQINSAFHDGELSGLHSVLVVHKGNIVVEQFFSGKDYKFGRSLGKRDFNARSLHDIRSITKNITGLLYGIALSENQVPEPDAVLIDQFQQYADLYNDPKLRKLKIQHALAMTLGTQWDESGPYTNTTNSAIAMERAPDRYLYVLEQPLIAEPGAVWTYNGGATTLVGEIITRGVNKPLDEYAQQKLFGPLGITNLEWLSGSDGSPSADAGLRMTARDLAIVGDMLLNNGQYNNQQIVPRDWLEKSFSPQSNRPKKWQYGYFWWLSPADRPPRSVDGFGNGAQRLYISREADLVIVIFAGNYNQTGAWKMPDRIINEIIVPALYSKKERND